MHQPRFESQCKHQQSDSLPPPDDTALTCSCSHTHIFFCFRFRRYRWWMAVYRYSGRYHNHLCFASMMNTFYLCTCFRRHEVRNPVSPFCASHMVPSYRPLCWILIFLLPVSSQGRDHMHAYPCSIFTAADRRKLGGCDRR